MCKSCNNCGNRMHTSYFGDGREPCFGWECAESEEDAIKTAAQCEEWCPEEDEEGDDHTSATEGDYGPGNPWDAPGMSYRDFI